MNAQHLEYISCHAQHRIGASCITSFRAHGDQLRQKLLAARRLLELNLRLGVGPSQLRELHQKCVPSPMQSPGPVLYALNEWLNQALRSGTCQRLPEIMLGAGFDQLVQDSEHGLLAAAKELVLYHLANSTATVYGPVDVSYAMASLGQDEPDVFTFRDRWARGQRAVSHRLDIPYTAQSMRFINAHLGPVLDGALEQD